MSENTTLKFGILCNSLYFEKWEADCIEHLFQHPSIELKLLVINNDTGSEGSRFLRKIFNYPYTHFLYRFYKRFFLKAQSYKIISYHEKFKEITKLYCTPIKKGKYSEYFRDDDITKIKNRNLDFMLRFGFNIIKGEILKSCKYGIWSFHHADNDLIRGGPMGFWEIYLKHKTSAAVLQQLNDNLDKGVVLRKGYLSTAHHSFKENIDQITTMASIWPLQVCIDILHHEFQDKRESIVTQAPIFRYPKNYQFVLFCFLLIKNKIHFHYNQLFKSESWIIAKATMSVKQLVNGYIPNFEPVLENSSEEYFADPFLWPDTSKQLMLFEHFSYKNNKGIIAMNNLHSNAYKEIFVATDCHFSYPFCFSYNKQVYGIPEQADSNKISLYQITEEGNIIHQCNLVENFAARDSSLFYYENYWWLFCSRKDNFENAALYIFYSDNLFQPFTAHQNNPVKTDVRNARPAGNLFMEQNRLYRPAQDSAGAYGSVLNINMITKLSPTAFQEEVVRSIHPSEVGNYQGIHHISIQGNTVLVDLKLYQFSRYNFINQLKRKFKKLMN